MADIYKSGMGLAFQLSGSGQAHRHMLYIKDFGIKPHPGKKKGCIRNTMLLAQEVTINEKDMFTAVSGLDDVKVLYTGGKDFGTFNATAIAFTGGAMGDGKAAALILKIFGQKGISNKKPCNVRWGTHNVKVYFTGCTVKGSTNHLIQLTLQGIIAPLNNKG